tara:strand:+ start:3934 stop:4131 length:198 start_codon:yes stop_codon:yes gene_type:complete
MPNEDKDNNVIVMKDVVMKMKQNAKGVWLAEVRVQADNTSEAQDMIKDALDIVTAETLRRNLDES